MEIAAKHEDNNLTKYDTQEARLYAGAAYGLVQIGKSIDQFNAATGSLNDILKNKAIAEVLKNLASISNDTADMSGEAKTAVHNFFHPKWPARIGGWLKEGALDAGKIWLP